MRAAIVALLALLVIGLTTAASGEKAGRVVRSELAGESVRLDLPTGDGRPKGLAVWFHGQGGNVNDRMQGPWLSALRRDGWAIASSDFHLQSWGNAASTDDVQRLTAWASEQVGLPVTLWVSGSMGGSVSLNALLHGEARPRCWYGVKPAISLKRMDAVPTADRYIAEAFGGDVPPDRNPVFNVDALPRDLVYRVVASPEDTWVPLDENGGALVSQLDALGVDVSYLPAEGPHEDPSHWDSVDLVAFANGCLER
ncbi:alpha/beta hydrolase family protein [Nocardioides sp.]|uniref:alpha/beta hydrolase family protein n=1 Tax=Nocardioides sp. TaxID=35761 RepID=UPI0035182024